MVIIAHGFRKVQHIQTYLNHCTTEGRLTIVLCRGEDGYKGLSTHCNVLILTVVSRCYYLPPNPFIQVQMCKVKVGFVFVAVWLCTNVDEKHSISDQRVGASIKAESHYLSIILLSTSSWPHPFGNSVF